jgi:hypothetical protein
MIHETPLSTLDLLHSSQLARGMGHLTGHGSKHRLLESKIVLEPESQNQQTQNHRAQNHRAQNYHVHDTSAFRELSFIYLEELFRSLRGEALLIAALSYGLAVPISTLRKMRVRDIGLFDRTIFIRGKEYQIPRGIIDDLREFFQERICGCDASLALESAYSRSSSNAAPHFLGGIASGVAGTTSVHNDMLFSSSAFCSLEETARSTVNAVMQTRTATAHPREISVSFNYQLKILARLHYKYAALKKHVILSPLDLFDKGPRIVRRGRGGVVTAYYLWRASRSVVGR